MVITVVVFLECLLGFNNSNSLNKIRLNQLKPFINNSNYDFFIYSIGNSFDFNKKIFKDLESLGIKARQYIAFITGKELTVFDEIINTLFFEKKEELKQKEDPVIIIGAPNNQLEWIQEANFSLLDWPNSVKPLTQLIHEQLLLPTNLTLSDQFMVNSENLRSKFFIPDSAKTSSSFDCNAKLQELLDLLPESEEYMRNLTQIIVELETKQLDLQKQIYMAEKGQTLSLEGQTHLLKELTVHYPLAITEIFLTSFLLLLHIPKGFEALKEGYNLLKKKYNFFGYSKPPIANDSELSGIKIEEANGIVNSLPNEPLLNKVEKTPSKVNYDNSNSEPSSSQVDTSSHQPNLAWLFAGYNRFI